MACADQALHAVSCAHETLKDIHVEDIDVVSTISCVDDKFMEDTHEKALDEDIDVVSTISCVDVKPMGDTNEKALEDIDIVISTMACVDDKPMTYTHEKIEVVEEMPKNEGQQSQIENKKKIINAEMIKRKKIFVGGLPSGISKEEFKNYFERFGTIMDVVVMQDSVTHRPRGFGFITFDSEKSVEDVMMNSFHDLNGRQVEVKRVIPKLEKNGVFDKLKSNYGKGTTLESFPHYYGTNIIPTPVCGSFPWYQNNGLYFYSPNPYGCYGASFPWYMPMMVPMTQLCPQSFGYCFPSYPYVGGNVGMKDNMEETIRHNNMI